MKICAKCGKECADNTVFCTKCGEKFAQQPTGQNENTQNSCRNGNSDAFYIGKGDVKKGNGKLLAILLPIIALLLVAIIVLLVIFIPMFNNRGRAPIPVPTEEPTAEPTEEPIDDNIIDVEEIDKIISQDANNADFSVYIIDLKNNNYYGTENSNNRMSASALINIPVLYASYQDINYGYLSMDDTVQFTYYSDGRGNIKKDQNGNYFTIDYLLQQMLNYSDNNATNSLVDYLGSDYIENICANNSYSSVEIQKRLGEDSDYKDNYVSARDISEMLAEMYESYDSTSIDADYLFSYFRIYDDASYDGVGRYLPSSVTFLNHNAVTSKTYNEVAIVSDGDVEYIITILSNNGKMETSATTAAEISSYVYYALS